MEIISNDEKIANLADQIVNRAYEVYVYDTNIQNYETLLAGYSGEWPEHLKQFQGMDPHMAAAECPMEYIAELSAAQQAERLSYLVKTEHLERNKANDILRALEAQMPEELADEAIAAAIERRNARLNAV